ncbi:hypothetical protein QE152_g32241 [Popillia japonica]|uniref:Uncharacterized protein n=1 Tax=Popillia japonica TaxID=7064 RepID=A0AAW1IZK7_POPJA
MVFRLKRRNLYETGSTTNLKKQQAIELVNLPLDNETITDEEQSEDEYFETSNMTTALHAQNLDNKNVNYEMESNIEIENNTPTAASEFSIKIRRVARGLMNQSNNPITSKKRGSAPSANPRNSPQHSSVCAKRRKYTYSVSCK